MRGAIIVILLLVLVGYSAMKLGQAFTAHNDFEERVSRQLEFVDENSFDEVKRNIVAEATKLGLEVAPAHISIIYRDTAQETMAQRLVGGLANFQNKQVGISVRYEMRILGFPLKQDVTCSKIRQVQVRRAPTAAEQESMRGGQ